MRQRSEAIQKAARTVYDVCVIGAGASGAGCALDSQLRGLSTLLVDAGDFGSATSSASTKLIHGGLRYLQQAVTEFDVGQYRVVRLALRERLTMMRNAPHLTRACTFAVPCFSVAKAAYYRIGVKLYDWLSGDAGLSTSSFLGRSRSLARMPWLKSNHLLGTVIYSDGQFDDARYNLSLVQSCAASGGEVLNYARVVGFGKNKQGRLVRAEVEDRESGERFAVTARSFINATGAFSDCIRRLAAPDAEQRLRPSKGVHILLPLPEGFENDALLIPTTEDGRIIFAIPWQGRLLVGTTDTESASEAEMFVTKAEAEYLLRHLNKYLTREFELSDIVSATAGLRPLVRSKNSRDTKKLVRDYEIEIEPRSGLISVLGGKWTVYRAMAEDAVNALQNLLTGGTTDCLTRNHPLAGSELPTDSLMNLAEAHLAPETKCHLVNKFGTYAGFIFDLTQQDPSLLTPLVDGAPQIQAEVVYCAREEMAVCVEDILARRLGLQFFDWNLAIQAAPVVGKILGQELGWSSVRTGKEVRSYCEKLSGLMQEIRNSPLRAEVIQ
jgi:glycerol-3-phosphate dehydrogenase